MAGSLIIRTKKKGNLIKGQTTERYVREKEKESLEQRKWQRNEY